MKINDTWTYLLKHQGRKQCSNFCRLEVAKDIMEQQLSEQYFMRMEFTSNLSFKLYSTTMAYIANAL